MKNETRDWLESMTFPIQSKGTVLKLCRKMGRTDSPYKKAGYANDLLVLSLRGDADRFRVNPDLIKE